jgi:hypothetical protein
MPISFESLVATTSATIAVGVSRSSAVRAGMSTPTGSLGWYARRVTRMSPADGVPATRRRGWPGRAGRSGDQIPAAAASLPAESHGCLLPDTAARVPAEAMAAVPSSADQLLRVSGRCWASEDRPGAARLVP